MNNYYQDLVKACNNFVWVHMYPSGQLEFGSHQHRDLVRTFFAGAFELLIITNNKEVAEILIPEYTQFAQEGWFPGKEFRPPANYQYTERN